jgi:hypothetical protein
MQLITIYYQVMLLLIYSLTYLLALRSSKYLGLLCDRHPFTFAYLFSLPDPVNHSLYTQPAHSGPYKVSFTFWHTAKALIMCDVIKILK